MWVVENVNGDDSLVKKEFETYEDAKAYSEWTLGAVRYVGENMKVYEDGKELKKNPDVEKFTVHYSDGTEKIIEKGFFCEIIKKKDVNTLDFIMAHCAGEDLRLIVCGCTQLGIELGFFD